MPVMSAPRLNILLLLLRATIVLLILRVTIGIVSNYPDYLPPDFDAEFLRNREGYFFWSLCLGLLCPYCEWAISDCVRAGAAQREDAQPVACVSSLAGPSAGAAGGGSTGTQRAGDVVLGGIRANRRDFAGDAVDPDDSLHAAGLASCCAAAIRSAPPVDGTHDDPALLGDYFASDRGDGAGDSRANFVDRS